MKHQAETRFNTGWEFQVDPYDMGIAYGHYRWRAEEPRWEFLRGWEDTRTQTVTLPHTWNQPGTEGWLYEGVAWYGKRFKAKPGWRDRRVWLRLEGVNKACQGWLNGQALGEHFGGYTPFEWELTRHLQTAEPNFVALRVDARPMPDDPLPLPGWKNYGGIHRDALVYTTGPVKIDWLAVLPRAVGKRSARLELVVELDGREACQLRIEIRNPDGTAVWSAAPRVPAGRRRREWRKRIALADPVPWDLDNPALYGITVTATVQRQASDTVEETFGIRRIDTRGGQVRLNGRPAYLKGVNRHDEHPEVGRAVTAKHHRRDLRLLRRLGANVVRLAHYPHHPEEAALYDREGLFCWAEVPVVWRADLADPVVRRRGLSQLRELVRRDINRPSVLCWSVANEVPTTEPGTRAYVRQAVKLVRELDSTRPVTLASSNHRLEAERCLDLVDIASVNYYAGWYGSMTLEGMEALLRELPRRYPDKPVLVSEFGSGSMPGLRGPADRKWTEDYHARALEEQLALIASLGRVNGCLIWCLADFADPTRSNKTTEGFVNNKGLFTAERRPKLAAAVASRWFRRMP